MKILLLYSYSEHSNRGLSHKEKNVLFFLEHLGDMDVYFIVNGEFNNAKIKAALEENPNIKVVRRQNRGFDFGAYSDVLLNHHRDYDYFFFINDSVRGPFIPFWNKTKWYRYFIDLLDDDIHLVGPTINFYMGRPHVTSAMFLLSKKGVELCIQHQIFSTVRWRCFRHVSEHCEVEMSSIMLDSGYNIRCLCEAYKNIDFRTCRGEKFKFDRNLNSNIDKQGDPLYSSCYFGGNVNIYEIVFVKANRGIDDALIDRYTDWQFQDVN
jgi:hypothetical protein